MHPHDVPDARAQADPIELEQTGWRALATSGDAATAFYAAVLDVKVVMVLPGGALLDDRDDILRSMSGPPWSHYQLDELDVLALTADVHVVTYRAAARRDGTPQYSALISSTYVHRPDGWRLAVHQQTPG